MTDAPLATASTDLDTGHVTLTVDADVAAALTDLLDGLDLGDMRANPGSHGLAPADADRQSAAGAAVKAALLRLYR
jgi:hypothetical protein